MHPDKVRRDHLLCLTDLPNVGPATAHDLELLGIHTPHELHGRCPYALHAELSRVTGVHQDPCVIDVFMSVISYVQGGPARPWWSFTPLRRQGLPTP